MNWVDRRHAREQNLTHSRIVWADLVSAMTGAVVSFNEHYRKENLKAEIGDPETNGDFRVSVPLGGRNSDRVDVTLAERKIHCRYLRSSTVKTFRIDADHESVFITCDGGQRCDRDEVSRRILEPLFFPSTQGGPQASVLV